MPSSRSGAQSTVLLAGWLFADLALGLVVILLATATDFPVAAAPSADPAPSPTLDASPAPSPSPTPVAEVGVEQEPVEFRVESDADALLSGDTSEIDDVADAIRRRLAPYEQEDRRAAFVLTFGGHTEPGQGTALARAANEILLDVAPGVMESAAMRDFWRATGSAGAATGTLLFEVYLFVD